MKVDKEKAPGHRGWPRSQALQHRQSDDESSCCTCKDARRQSVTGPLHLHRGSGAGHAFTVVSTGEATDALAAKTLAGKGFLGSGVGRKLALADARETRRERVFSEESATEIFRDIIGDKDSADESADDFEGDREAFDRAALDREEKRALTDKLPAELGDYLRRMPGGKRLKREAAIRRKFGEWRKADRIPFDYLEILEMDAWELAAAADNAAAKYAKKFPATEYQGPEHRKRRCEKWWRKRLKREQKKALGYVEAACAAVGGPARDDRPLYVSDYTVRQYRSVKAFTRELLGSLFLVNKDDPTIQIPMLDVDARARRAKAAKLRLWIDMSLLRWEELGWRICWITVTLPGRFVCHSTNEGNRTSEWDERLGPDEAMQEMQERHHSVMALLRARGLRPTGWWNSQPQQSGTVHRHYILAVPSLADARAVCDGFREKFGSEIGGNEGEDRGCDASVIGDDDPRYRTRNGRDGNAETAASAARYSARYATRYENAAEVGAVADGEEIDVCEDPREAGEQERFEAWAWLRGARRHAWLGLDSGRAPGRLWDTLWAEAGRQARQEAEGGERFMPDDPRMQLALREIEACQQVMATAAAAREGMKYEDEGSEEAEALDAIAEAASADAARHAWQAAVAMGVWPDRDLSREEWAWMTGEISEFSDDPLPPHPLREARESVYGESRQEIVGAVGVVERFRTAGAKITFDDAADAVLATGVTVRPRTVKIRRAHWLLALEDAGYPVGWREERMTLAELEKLCGRLGVSIDPRFVEVETTGDAVAALKDAGFRFSQRPDGTIAGFDLSGEIVLLHEDEWEILDKADAQRRVEELEAETDEQRMERFRKRFEAPGLSLSPTDPRNGPGGPPHGDLREPEPPPI